MEKTEKSVVPVQKEFYSLEELADLHSVTYQRIYKVVRSGELPAARIGKVFHDDTALVKRRVFVSLVTIALAFGLFASTHARGAQTKPATGNEKTATLLREYRNSIVLIKGNGVQASML